MTKNDIYQIFEILSKNNQDPKTELSYINEFTLLIAVILSAQVTDKLVNSVTKELFLIYYTPEKIIQLGLEELIEKIKKIRFYRVKGTNIINICKILVEKYNSKIPNKFEDLISLPGVGRKTADVVLNECFGLPTIAVDRHVYRVSKRIGITKENTINKVADNLLKIIPKKYMKIAHHLLILHGRYVCKAQKPKCSDCQIKSFCKHYKNIKKT